MKARRSAFPSPLRTPPDVVAGRYRLGARLGSGGAADVYEAVDLCLERPVALKVFRPGADPAMAGRFADEAVLLAGLQHPNLVTVYDAGRHEECAYLVMQLVKGPTLAQRISAGAMEPARVARIGSALAQALAEVHAAGIVHRDVKPSNVLLDAADVPHLTDFGISRMMDATRRTASGELIGTAAYLAPEQALGKAVGPPADIYALGLVLLECLKGEHEYGGTPLEAAVARLHRPPVVPASVPPALAELLRAMTTLEDTARPDAARCAEVLAALSDGDLVPARTAQRGGRMGARRPLLVTGTAVLTALLGAVLAIAPEGQDTGDDRAAPDTSRSAPVRTPSSPPVSPESPRASVRQPAASASPSAAPSTASGPASPSGPGRVTSPSRSDSGPGPGTPADREDAPSRRAGGGPGAAVPGGAKPSEKPAQSNGRAADKQRQR
ncbi:serine/threonine-protein kinase [Streptomyces sp. NPDC052682]|uniref:serine/threonine-protein kinase n=1 Tax=Streptomyces sp. NPDC052682 TaxID=3154954 RepID=UPI0034432A26